MKFEIRRAKNGYIMTAQETEPPNEIVYQESFEDEIESFAAFLRFLNDEFGPSTSRYSPKRIYVVVGPGDKYEKEVE